MAATVWLLPLPGGPEMTVVGSCRARTTASRWAGVSSSGLVTSSSGAAAGGTGEPA
jgi:hypothetical protein